MTESGIRLGAFVRHATKGVGRIEETGNNPSVLFWTEKEYGKTEKMPTGLMAPLPNDSPEALLWDHPEELASWAEERPLQLVALALSVRGGKDKLTNVKKVLDLVPGCKSSSWWSPTQAKLKLPELNRHFEIAKTGISLHSNVDSVPKDADLLGFLQSIWQDWLLYDPSKPVVWMEWPNKESLDALDRVLARLGRGESEQSLHNTMQSVQIFLKSPRKKTPSVALNWLETLSRVHLRWDDGAGIHGDLAMRTGEVLRDLCQLAGYNKSGQWLLQAYTLMGMSDSWRQGFVAGMWAASSSPTANAAARRRLFNSASSLMGRQGRVDLTREIAIAAFRADDATRCYPEPSEIDRILSELTSGEETQRLLELIALSSNANQQDKDKLLSYIANSRHSKGPERLNLLALAALLLADGEGAFAAQASRELADAFVSLEEEYHPAMQAIFRYTRARIAEERARIAGEMDSLRQVHSAELEIERREQERLRMQVRDLGAELSANREESRLEIRRDMLLAVGEILQSVRRRDNVEDIVGDVEAGLRLALRAGGADLLDTAPKGYDPRLHHATEELPESTPVKVIAPGVIVRGGSRGDWVLLRAQVKHEVN